MEDNVEYEEDTLAADLAAVFDEAVQEDEPDDGIEIRAEEAPGDTDTGTDAPDVEAVPETVEAGEQKPVEASADVDGMPVGLPASAREAGKDTPKAVKAAVAKREKDFATGIQKYAEGAKRAMAMDQTLSPYRQYMEINGGPQASISTLLKTGALLQSGSGNQKAQLIAQMINQFGVDVNALDNLLVGRAPPPQSQETSVQQLVQQEMQRRDGAQQQARRQYDQQQATGEVNQFAQSPKNEFYRDVRADMADMLDMAGRRGQQMTMQQAYDRACMMNPEVSGIIQARKNGLDMQNKRKAAVSITGGPGGPGGGGESTNSITEALNAAWDAVDRV